MWQAFNVADDQPHPALIYLINDMIRGAPSLFGVNLEAEGPIHMECTSAVNASDIVRFMFGVIRFIAIVCVGIAAG